MERVCGHVGFPTFRSQAEGPSQKIASPAGETPAVITTIPGFGSFGSQVDRALAAVPAAPGETAAFETARLESETSVVGSATVDVAVTSDETSDAVLFAGLRDVAADGSSVLLSRQVAPLRVSGLTPGTARTVRI